MQNKTYRKGQRKNAISGAMLSEFSNLSCKQRKKLRPVIHARYMRLTSIEDCQGIKNVRDRLQLNCNPDLSTDRKLRKLQSLDRLVYLDIDQRNLETLDRNAVDANQSFRDTADSYQKDSMVSKYKVKPEQAFAVSTRWNKQVANKGCRLASPSYGTLPNDEESLQVTE